MKNAFENFFDPRSLQRGRALQRDGAVVDWWVESEDGMLCALVQGTRASPYEVTVLLDDTGNVEYTECSCPVGVNCKHAVATILEYQQHAQVEYRSMQVGGGSAPVELGGPPQHMPPGIDQATSVSPRSSSEAQDDHQVDAWYARLRGSLSNPDELKSLYMPGQGPRDARERIYTLMPKSSAETPTIVAGVSLTLLDAPRTAAGHYNKGRRAEPGRSYLSWDTQLTSLDKDIESLGGAQISREQGRWANDPGRYDIDGRTGHVLFELALESGRCFIGTDRRSPVTLGEPRTLQLVWQSESDGRQRLAVELDGLATWWAVATDPPCWIDPASATAGAIDTELNGAQLLVALDAPPLTALQMQRLAEEFDQELSQPALQTLPIPRPPIELSPLIDSEPTPVLILWSTEDDPHVDTWRLLLMMRYQNALVPCSYRECEAITRTEDENGQSVRIKRDPGREVYCFFELMRRSPGLLPFQDELSGELIPEFSASGEDPAARFGHYRQLVRQREALEQECWTLMVLPPVHTEPLRPGRFEGLVQQADDGPGWFDIELGFDVNGVRHDLLTLVTQYVERGGGDEPLLIETGEGRFVEVPAEVLRPVAQTFIELGTPTVNDGKVRLSRARALALEGLEQTLGTEGIETLWRGSREPFELAEQLRSFAQADTSALDRTAVPRGLKATMRPYQRTGLGWLNTLAKHNLCGILADDMGLGKTLQALAHILWLRQSRRLKGPVLVVAPTSLLMNWAREADRFTPRLRVRIWHGLDRTNQPLDADDRPADLVITSYGLVRRDRDLLAEHGFDFLILDEAQQIRNPMAKTTRAIKSLPIQRRLSLSGTPLENHLGELWSQFDFLMPGLLGDSQHFSRHFRTPIERHGDKVRQQRLAAAVAPFLLRRRKEMVATELPPKTEMLREVQLGDAQAKLYESIRVSMKKRVREALEAKGLAQSHVTVLTALLKLRQLCCHPHLLKMDSAQRLKDSAKTTVALDMIDELVAEGRRILVFSSFTSMLTILERELTQRGHDWVKLTGQTRKRDEAIDTFQRGEVPVFLISLKAGGTGLNLTAADTVIHYDPWWNPAAEEQASARAHRIGQEKPVFVYRLVTADTVEQRIVAMQQRKRDLADAMIEGGESGSLSRLSVDETLALFDS